MPLRPPRHRHSLRSLRDLDPSWTLPYSPPAGVTVLEVRYLDIFLAEWRFSDTIDDIPNDPPDLRINGQSPNTVDGMDGNTLRLTYGFVDNGYPWTTSHYTPGDIIFTSGDDLVSQQSGNVI